MDYITTSDKKNAIDALLLTQKAKEGDVTLVLKVQFTKLSQTNVVTHLKFALQTIFTIKRKTFVNALRKLLLTLEVNVWRVIYQNIGHVITNSARVVLKQQYMTSKERCVLIALQKNQLLSGIVVQNAPKDSFMI